MNEQLLTGKLLKARGWPEGKVIGLAKAAGEKLQRNGLSRDEVLNQLDAVRKNPRDWLEDTTFGAVALETLRREVVEQARYDDKLREAPLEFPIWGRDGIDVGAIAQMETSMALPITAAGALMPDAHIGYGLPIGGVLAHNRCCHSVCRRCRYCLSDENFDFRGFTARHRTARLQIAARLTRQYRFRHGGEMDGRRKASARCFG